jgi:hypothetical protein
VASIDEIEKQADLPARSGSGSHNAIFKMPWSGDPRINLQNKNGKAKPYQVKQAIAAIDRSKEK